MVAGIKLTLHDFLNKADKKHENEFDYTSVEYVNSATKVKIRCKLHGIFEQTPGAHLTGRKCPLCAHEKTGLRCRGNKDDFVSRSNKLHSNKYTYDKVVYVNQQSKVIITCKKHGDFEQKPNHHLSGVGCCSCGKEATAVKLARTTEEFIKQAVTVHGDRYNYSNTIYINSGSKVRMICKDHGEWTAAAQSHLSGCGCPTCASGGFSTQKLGSIYVLEFDDITKVGITNRIIERRMREIINSSGKSFTLMKAYHEIPGDACSEIEATLLKRLRENYKCPDEEYDGYTECFKEVDRVWLLNLLEDEINNGKRKT